MNRMIRSGLTALMLLLAAFALALPAGAETYATTGNGGETSIFFVESFGSATLNFAQEEGLCRELSYTHAVDGIQGDEEEWGKYHIYVETPGGSAYSEDWDKTFHGGSYSLTLNGAGTYRILVVPYTASEMTASWTLDQFISWTTYPHWWISGQINCLAKPSLTASVYVQQVDRDTGAVLSSRSETVRYGNNTVTPGAVPAGYTLVSSGSANVYVDSTGRPDVPTVTFYYRRNVSASALLTVNCYDENGVFLQSSTDTVTASRTIYPPALSGYTALSGGAAVAFNSSTGVCSPGSVSFYYRRNAAVTTQPAPSSGRATPYTWDTQFKPGFSQDDNQEQYRYLSRLYDDNAATHFWWIIWKSERTDNIPELTAYFNGDTVSTISIRNGNLLHYSEFARLARLRVCIYHAGGMSVASVSLPDVRSDAYQTFSLGGTYTGVSRIELFLDGGGNEGFYMGSQEPYIIYVTDIQFGR